jgi:hypothetical protein
LGNIKWSALSVSQAMDKVEKEIEAIFEPLWRAEAIVRENMGLPNLPDYMKSSLSRLQGEIYNITGHNLQKHGSRLLDSIHMVRNDLPEGSVEAEIHRKRHGETATMM